MIDFQGALFGGKYTVNLGFHYSFAPGFFRGKQLQAGQVQLLDCAFRARIGDFIPGGLDVWFPYGNDRERLRATFNENAALCLATFERFSRKWQEPEQWLAKISLAGKYRSTSTKPWDLHYPLLLAACVAKKAGKSALAANYLKQFILEARSEDWRIVLTRLAGNV